MLNRQKTLLPKKLEMITLKLKSFVFMKIFMQDSFSPTRENKVRHYDLELEGATAISSWLKNKLQQVYLRSFDRLKQSKKLTKAPSSSNYKQVQSQPYISAVNSQVNSPSKQMESRTRCQTDRELYVKGKQSNQVKNVHKNYRSEFGQQTQQSQNSRKSNLQSLLQKVRQVNTQSKIDKQNEQYKANNDQFYQESYTGSRVLSNRTGIIHRHMNKPSQPYQSKNITFKHHPNLTQNTYYPGQRHQSTYINYMPAQTHHYPQQFQTPNSQVQKIISRLDMEEDCVMDKTNLLSLKKWHKNQKRSVIMNKIKELQNSLMAEYDREGEVGFGEYEGEGDFYPVTNYGNAYDQIFGQQNCSYEYQMLPNNYSQTYFQEKSVRHPPRSVYEVKMRKY